MTGLLDKVAFITGAARGQGHSHAVRLAEEGADIIAVDICADIASVPYPLASPDDLEQTVKAVEALKRRVVAREVDVRDAAALQTAFNAGLDAFGRVDIVVANAGILPLAFDEKPQAWQDVIDVNLTGVFNTVEVAAPSMIESGRGDSIVLRSSTAGLNGVGGPTRGGLAYTASKHGVVGLMRAYANYFAEHKIRVNSVHPTAVNTPMVVNDAVQKMLAETPSLAEAMNSNALPVEMVEAIDIANAVAFLVSDEARYITGIALPVDAGFTNKK
jgi:SDR family mycofactocin-dependent oxidoreductase